MTSTFTSRLAQYTTRLINSCSDPHQELVGDHAQFLWDGNVDGAQVSSAYAKPFLVLDLTWNMFLVLVTAGVLWSTCGEHPSTPLRVWLCGYAFQCILQMGFVYFEYRRNSLDSQPAQSRHPFSQNLSRIVKRLESLNTVISSIWWVFGFYWIVMSDQAFLQDCPRLYWSTVVFLAFDVFFIIFCAVVACITFFCIAPVLLFAFALSVGEGATEKEISSLPKYEFHHSTVLFVSDDNKKHIYSTGMESNNSINELSLQLEDSDCCICLCRYVDGAELYRLPCNHLFHCGCISRWLRINATCPLCKANILRGDTLV